jgi:hypothetical protein
MLAFDCREMVSSPLWRPLFYVSLLCLVGYHVDSRVTAACRNEALFCIRHVASSTATQAGSVAQSCVARVELSLSCILAGKAGCIIVECSAARWLTDPIDQHLRAEQVSISMVGDTNKTHPKPIQSVALSIYHKHDHDR